MARALTIILSVAAVLILCVSLTYSISSNLARPGSRRRYAMESAEHRLDAVAQSIAELTRLLSVNHSLATQPTPQPLRPSVAQPLVAADYSGNYLIASHEPLPTVHGALDVSAARLLLKSLLGMARLLNRQLILPASLCDCEVAVARDGTVEHLKNCAGPFIEPFGCPLRAPLASMLHLEAWRDARVRKMLRPADLLTRDPAAVPRELRSSHVRVLLPDAMSDGETRYALRSYSDTRLLEIERASQAYCGWDARHDKKSEGPAFDAWADALLQPTEAFLASWRDVTLRSPTALVPCQHFHGGAGEVQRFTNIGVCYRPRGRANAALAKACLARIWTRTKSPVITD